VSRVRPPEFDPFTHAIIGAAIEVHRTLGWRFLEAAYHRALIYEFEDRGIEFRHEVDVPLYYKDGRPLGVPFRADFVCGDVIVELKALPAIGHHEARQVRHYVSATGLRVGLLLNFGTRLLQVERFENEGS
jgi:GxxExxY protein